MSDQTPLDLVARARAADKAQQTELAEALWSELDRLAPSHPMALFRQGREKLQARNASAAIALLREAEAGEPGDAEIPLFLGLAFVMSGNLPSALDAYDRALACDPYFFLALASKASVVERMGQPRAAAKLFRDALKIAPTTQNIPPFLSRALAHARAAIDADKRALGAYLQSALAPLRGRFESQNLSRFDHCLAIFSGAEDRPLTDDQFPHDPSLLYFPDIPATPFYDSGLFPWMAELEAAAEGITSEFKALYKGRRDAFAPYIQFPDEAPVNQWGQLNKSKDWSTYFLWRDGIAFADHLAQCPMTTAAMSKVPLCDQAGFGPTVMFSALAPHTHIPPHTGSTNVRLIGHLALIIPDHCRYRVGAVETHWTPGRVFIFDDSIEHEARNDSDFLRVVLIFDVWNPALTEAERTLVTAMLTARNQYFEDERPTRFV